MGFNCLRATASSRRQLTFYHSVPRNSFRIAFIKVDNDPDWSLLNVTNELYFTRLWKDSGQDVLGIVSYALRSGQHITTWNTYRVPRVKK